MLGIWGRFRWIVFSAVCAGMLAGAVLGGIHYIALASMIAQAEVYEASGGASAQARSQEHAHMEAEEVSGAERAVLTLLADMLAGIGFGLLLSAGMALRGGWVSLRAGLLWGVAGFLVFSLAPGLGLPPELPGAEAAPLAWRQVWWLCTVAATAAGLALLAFGYRLTLAILGLGLIAAPHLVGAPPPPAHTPLVPAELTRQFMLAAMGSNLVFWLLLGGACVYFLRRFAPGPVSLAR